MKAIYGLRSKIVHGNKFDIEETFNRGDRKVRAVDAAAEYLSAALRILIEHAEYLDLARIDHELLLAGSPQGRVAVTRDRRPS